MTQATDNPALRNWRRLAIATWIGIGLILALAVMGTFAAAALADDENIPLVRNEVVRAPSGERVWQGRFWNHTDSLYTRLDAVILFLDEDGKPVGQARGAAVRLDPGEYFDFSALLPPEAARMQMYQLRWTGPGGGRVTLGPYRPWEFGYEQAPSACGELRLSLGSCYPMRETDGTTQSAVKPASRLAALQGSVSFRLPWTVAIF